jgi:predicted PurR-regulated permease PerM/methylmalonyl-CoA mutase cobalamin-binding subunit
MLSRERQFSPLFILVAIIAVVAALYVAKQILLPVFLAVLLSFLLTPLANRMEHWGLPRIPAVIAIVLIAFAALGMLGWIVTAQVSALQAELPNHRASIKAKVRLVQRFSQALHGVGESLTKGDEATKNVAPRKSAAETLADPAMSAPPEAAATDEAVTGGLTAAPVTPPLDAQNLPEGHDSEMAPPPLKPSDTSANEAVPVKVVAMPPSPLTQAQAWLGFLAAPLTAAGMVFVLVFFMLLDRENQRNRLIQLFGASNLHSTTEALHDATHRVGRYLRMQFLINAGYGVAVATGLWIIGVPSAIMWGVLGFTLRFLPYLGPWLAAVLPILVSLAVSDGWTQPIIVVCMYIVYELVLNNVAEPMLYGSSTGVSTVGVILSAIFWTWLWGPIGLILAMPMTVCLVVMSRYVPQLRFINVMLADQPPLTPAQRVYQRLLAFDYSEPLKLAKTQLETSSLASFCDEVLIPALTLAEHDRHAGLLNDEQDAFVLEAAEELVDELRDSAVAAEAAKTASGEAALDESLASAKAVDKTAAPTIRVLCVPLRDRADEIAAKMLAHLLSVEGFDVDSGSTDALASEVVDRVASSDTDIVIISVLPPIRPRESRLLWKRLRDRYPDLTIIVGYWIGPKATESLLPPPGDDASKVATTLQQAVTLVRAAAAQPKLAKAV